MFISPEVKEQILAAAKIEDVVSQFVTLKKSGISLSGVCPMCNHTGKGKSLVVTPSKGIVKCFSCGFGTKSAVDFLEKTQKMDFPTALKWLADYYNILIDTKPFKAKKKDKSLTKLQEITFLSKQLESSGLTPEDVQATVVMEDQEDAVQLVEVFESGTRNEYGQFTPAGDDMLIWYYDLEGKPVMYKKPKVNKMERFFRVRWQNPDAHIGKDGRAKKYESPFGSGNHLFIPQAIRKIYQEGRQVNRLFLNEGEKKSEKSCKHGMISVGIPGIQNVGAKGQLPYEFELLVKRNGVKEVVMVLDSDWCHLSDGLKSGDKVDSRIWNFFHAVKNYRDYFKTFINLGVYLEIYFAVIKDNDSNEKGIDDLLSGSLKGNEIALKEDFDYAFNDKGGNGKYVQVFKITEMPESKILELFHLNGAEAFSEFYHEKIKDLIEFKIGKLKWRYNEEGKLIAANPITEDQQYWEKKTGRDRNGQDVNEFKFCYGNLFAFLKARGFGRRYIAPNSKKFEFVYVDGKIVDNTDNYAIRDYVIDFTKNVVDKVDNKEVLEMLYRGGKSYFGPEQLSYIDFPEITFQRQKKESMLLYFRETYWEINSEGTKEFPITNLNNHVWKDKLNNVNARLMAKPMIDITRNNKGEFNIEITEEGSKCHFLNYLWYTSHFYWRKVINPYTREELPANMTPEENQEVVLHFLSKMTAMAYLVHKFRNKSCQRAVIAMDAKNSEVGDSNGRTGKSLYGDAIRYITTLIKINGKAKNLEEDRYLYEEVSDKTDVLFFDDVRKDFNLETFFSIITGQLTLEKKFIGKITLSEQDTPKIFITTNHAIAGGTSSFKDRQFLLAFSDYYNEKWKPVDDFGLLFFDEWDEDQWNLFYNFVASCIHVYFKALKLGWGVSGSGLIEPPMERLEHRRLRQEVSETFLSWADDYFGVSDDEDTALSTSMQINEPGDRIQMMNDFLEKNQMMRKFCTANYFRKKMVLWCKYRGLRFNPRNKKADGEPGGDDKRGGIGYFTVANARYEYV